MSNNLRKIRLRRKARRENGFTLIELLVAVTLSAVLITSLSATILVILKQQANANGRVNNARSEYGVGFWLPADLASAGQNVDTLAGSTPCFGACPAGTTIGGSNALLLTWTSQVPNAAGSAAVTQSTKVSYRYIYTGTEYQLIRVQCDLKEGVQTCRTNVVLHNLDAPPDGNFLAGQTVPDWIIKVTIPPDAAATSDTEVVANAATAKNAQRVVVTVNGGGGAGGGNNGGQNQISLSAGGTNRSLIDASSLQGAPSLIAARSLCGGSLTMVIDRSGSIGSSAFAQVKSAVLQFVTNFVGTPVRLKLVPFDTYGSVLGATSPTWSVSYNMLNSTDQTTLLNLVTNMSYPAGNTNWEDGLYRVFYNADGTVAQDLPGTVVFFTDGVPTTDRLTYKTSTASATPPAALPGYTISTGGNYNQQAYYRANLIAAAFRDTTRFIGVLVGPDARTNVDWITNVPGYHYDYGHSYHYNYTHSYHATSYTHWYDYTYSRYYHVEKGYHYSSTIDRGYFMEKKVSGNWAGTPDLTATTGTAPSSTERIRFKSSSFGASTPLTLFKTGVTMSAHATVDMATTWTAPGSGTLNSALVTSQDVPDNGPSDGTDGWKNGRTYTSPYSYWEIDTAATSSTQPSASATPNERVSFSTPYSFSVTVDGSTAPTADDSTSWTAYASGTNNSLYTAQNVGASDTDSTDGWTTAVKVYGATPQPYSTTTTSSVGYSTTDPSWTAAKVYTPPYTWVDTNTVGYDSGGTYSSTDPSWTISAKMYSSPFTNVDTDSVGTGYSSTDPSWSKSVKQYSLPYTGYDTNSPVTVPVSSDKVLARLVANSDTGVPATTDSNGKYTNALVANMYILPSWSQFAGALQAIALSQCGGTLTLQTKLGTANAADPFTYQKTAITDSAGHAQTSDMTVVTTTQSFNSGTFDLNITDGTYVTVDIQPSNLSDLAGYTSGTWACQAGITNRPFTPIAIPNSTTWTGIRVKVAANEAVSCTQTVTR